MKRVKLKKDNSVKILFVLLLFSNSVFSQIIKDYYDYSKNNKIEKMKAYYFKDKRDNSVKQKVIYLGTINSNKNYKYKVFTSHTNLGNKGVNELVFVSIKGKVHKYYMNIQSDMPFKLYANKLYFKNYQTKDVKSMKINTLRSIFCTPFECF